MNPTPRLLFLLGLSIVLSGVTLTSEARSGEIEREIVMRLAPSALRTAISGAEHDPRDAAWNRSSTGVDMADIDAESIRQPFRKLPAELEHVGPGRSESALCFGARRAVDSSSTIRRRLSRRSRQWNGARAFAPDACAHTRAMRQMR
jgi:hypothetical protein